MRCQAKQRERETRLLPCRVARVWHPRQGSLHTCCHARPFNKPTSTQPCSHALLVHAPHRLAHKRLFVHNVLQSCKQNAQHSKGVRSKRNPAHWTHLLGC